MELNKIKLGKYIEQYSETCSIPNLSKYDISGINKDKEFFEPSNQIGQDTSLYKIVPPKHFACNLMHVGRDVVLPIAYNNTNKEKVVSPAYNVFKVIDNEELSSEYFFLLLKCKEKDRYFWFNTDGSVRDGMSWEDFANVNIELPPLRIQEKYVDVYNAMVENQKSYERGLDDLKLTCDAYIENLKQQMECVPIGKYLIKAFKNVDGTIQRVRGIGQSGFIIPQKEPNESLKNYKILSYNSICYAPPLYNVLTGALHLYKENELAVCSPIYEVFKCDEVNLMAAYLELWLKRDEFKRYAAYFALGVRQTFEYQLMEEVKIPIPGIRVQKAIASIYATYVDRKNINEHLKQQIKNICPILIKGSIEEGKKKSK